MYPRIKKVVCLMEWWKNFLLYSVSVLLFFFLERQCVREKIRCFFNIFETVWILFSLHFKAQKKQTKKTFIFCFFQSLFWLIFFSTFFPFLHFHLVVFVRFFLSSFCSSLLVFLSFFFSLFSPSFSFSQSQCLSSSFFFNLMFPYFFHRRFCVSSFWINSFFFSLLFLIPFLFSSFFYSFPYPFFHVKPNTKFSPFFRRSFFWTLPFPVFNLVFFLIVSSLFLVCSMFWGFLSGSWNYFSWFSFDLSSFRVSSKNCRCFWTQLSKNIIDFC